jgi:hypothetical protein
MPLSWNEIKDRALRFSREWADDSRNTAAPSHRCCLPQSPSARWAAKRCKLSDQRATGEARMSRCTLVDISVRALVVLGLGCIAGCQSQADSAAAREQARQAQRVTPVSVAKHVVQVRAAAQMGDPKAVQRSVEGMSKDILHDARIPDPSRPIGREAARAAVRPLAGVRSVVWIDHDNLLVMVGGAEFRNMAMVDRVCDTLAPLGDTLGVVVNVQDVTATTSAGADAVSRNCQLPEGQRAFLQRKRQIEALDPATRRAFEAQQGSSSR